MEEDIIYEEGYIDEPDQMGELTKEDLVLEKEANE